MQLDINKFMTAIFVTNVRSLVKTSLFITLYRQRM
jgi:hypothetical protein